MDSAESELSAAVIRRSALVSGSYAGAIFIDLCLIKKRFEKAAEMLEKGEEKGAVCMGTKAEVLAERPGLYILAGDGKVKGEYKKNNRSYPT